MSPPTNTMAPELRRSFDTAHAAQLQLCLGYISFGGTTGFFFLSHTTHTCTHAHTHTHTRAHAHTRTHAHTHTLFFKEAEASSQINYVKQWVPF